MSNYFEDFPGLNKYFDSIGFDVGIHFELHSYYIKNYKGYVYELVIERDHRLDRVEKIYMKMRKYVHVEFVNKDKYHTSSGSGKIIFTRDVDIDKYDFDVVLRDNMLKYFKEDIRKRKIKRILDEI